MNDITAAMYKKYNANTSGKASPDCVKRAISFAFNIPYNDVGKELNKIMHEYGFSAWNVPPIYEKLIYKLGGKTAVEMPHPFMTVEEFCDKHPQGTYILETASKETAYNGNHLTCIVDNTLYDSWNSLNQYVVLYYECEPRKVQLTDIKNHFPELCNLAWKEMVNNFQHYIKKYDYHGADIKFVRMSDGTIKGYTIYQMAKFRTEEYVKEIDKVIKFNPDMIKIAFVFTPETTLEEAKEIIKKTAKVRMYDRLYEAYKQYTDERDGILEQYKVQDELTDAQKKHIYDPKWLSGRELQLYKKLPPKIKARLNYINCRRPGEYSDSYEIWFYPVPGDHRSENVKLWGYDSKMIMNEIDYYLNHNYLRPYDDYDAIEEWG